jgi:hypothetical protein
MVFGDYNIDVTNTGAGDILIHYQSHSPIIGGTDGEVSFNCDLTSTAWGARRRKGRRPPGRIDPQRDHLPAEPVDARRATAAGRSRFSVPRSARPGGRASGVGAGAD